MSRSVSLCCLLSLVVATGCARAFVVPVLADGQHVYAVVPQESVSKDGLPCQGEKSGPDLTFQLRRIETAEDAITVVVSHHYCKGFAVSKGGEAQVFGRTVATVRSSAWESAGVSYLAGTIVVQEYRKPGANADVDSGSREVTFYVAHDPVPLVAFLFVAAGATAILSSETVPPGSAKRCYLEIGKVGWGCRLRPTAPNADGYMDEHVCAGRGLPPGCKRSDSVRF